MEIISKKRKLKIRMKKKLKTRKDSEDEEKLIEKLKRDEKQKPSNFLVKQENSDNESNDPENHNKSSGSSSEKFEMMERDLNLVNEIEQLLDYSIISKILRLFNFKLISNKNTTYENYKEIDNLKKENISKYIFNIFQRIVVKINSSWIFYQVEYLSIIQEIMNDKLFSKDPYFTNLRNIFKIIIKNFFDLFNKNRLLIIESLFRYTGPMHKNQILSNYEHTEIDIDNDINNSYKELNDINNDKYLNVINNNHDNLSDDDALYDGKILFERDDENVKVIKETKKRKEEEFSDNLDLIKWTENEDLILIDNYYEFKDHEDYIDILDKLFPLKTSKDIKNRIKTLKLRKGYEKAIKILRKIHQKKKEKEENLFNVITELSDECTNQLKKQKIEKTISAIKIQLKSYKLKKDLLENSPEIDCILIPTSNDEIDTFKDKKFIEFIRNIGFVPPAQVNIDSKKFDIIDLTKYDNDKNHNYKENIKDKKNRFDDKMDILENELYDKNKKNDEKIILNEIDNIKNDLMDIVENNNNFVNLDLNKYDLNKFWKINPNSNITDIEIMIEKLQNFEKVINES